VKIVTLQYVLATFSIVGSSLLLLVTLLIQIIQQYYVKPHKIEVDKIPKSQEQTMDKSTINKIQKLKDTKLTVEVLTKKKDELETEISKNTIIRPLVLKKRIPTEVKAPRFKQYREGPSFSVTQETSNEVGQLQGMRIEYVTLLMEIGIKNAYELSTQNPEELYRKILERKRSHENKDQVPTKSMILRWIRIARIHVHAQKRKKTGSLRA
jgi:hypothetical protein